MESRSPHEGRRHPAHRFPAPAGPWRADPLAPQTEALVPALPAQLRSRSPGPNRRRHAAHPPPGAPPAPRRRSLPLQLLGDSGDTQTRAPTPTFPTRQTSLYVHPHSYPQMPACMRDHTHTHTHARPPAGPGAQPHVATKHPDRRRDRQRRGPQRPLPPGSLPCCSPRPRLAGSAPRCAQVAFLKGKLHQPPEAQCRRESARPAAPLAAPPELVVFWFQGGGGQEFGESLESGEGLGDLAKSLPSLNSSPGLPAHPPHLIPTPDDFSGSSSQGIKLQVAPAFR